MNTKLIKDKCEVILQFETGCRLSLATGEIEKGHPDRMSTLHFYHACPGSRLNLQNEAYAFAVATYSLKRDERYLYTYDYQKEENWSVYNHDLTPEAYRQEDYVFLDEVFFRVNIKRMDEREITQQEAECIEDILRYETQREIYVKKDYLEQEAEKTVASIEEKDTGDMLKLILLADSHYTINGTWKDTAYNVKQICERSSCHGIVHLGDMTDGMVSRQMTGDYVKKMQSDLGECNVPVYYILGNHDSNYFRNVDRFSEEEQQRLYLEISDPYICREQRNSFYYVDFGEQEIRGIFLDSFDFREEVRYGFTHKALDWLEDTLRKTPESYSIILFSHVPPLAEIHYWSDVIRNSERLMAILEDFQETAGKRIMAYIHGHNHADQIYRKQSFPILSIGCAKCEYITDKKAEGSYTYPRTPDMVSQELWDVILVSKAEGRIELIRFGAGEDRTVINGDKNEEGNHIRFF